MKGSKHSPNLNKGHSKKMPKDDSNNNDSDDNDDNIVFECESDGIVITENSRYWIYILAKEQWDFIQNNMKKDILYISAYTKKNIQKNDTILFFVKDKPGKPTGFVAIGQTSMIMEENKNNIRIYNDKNMNRFITELDVISIFECVCKIQELIDTIINTDTSIKNSTAFTKTYLKGEGVFIEIVKKHLALNIVKKLFEIDTEKRSDSIEYTIDVDTSIEESENSDDDDSDRLSSFKVKAKQIANTKMGKMAIAGKMSQNQIKSNTPSSQSTKSLTIKPPIKPSSKPPIKPSSKPPIKQFDNDDSYDSDIVDDSCDSANFDDNCDTGNTDDANESDGTCDTDESNDDDDDDDNNNEEEDNNENNNIVTNIPVMLIICDQLRRTLKRQKQKINKIKTVLDHYRYCKDCDITNNNSHELNLTLSSITESNVKFIENNCDKALESYLNMTPFPTKTKNEFIKINHMTHNLFYTEDILLQYSTKLEPIVEIVEPKKKSTSTSTSKPMSTSKPVLKTNIKTSVSKPMAISTIVKKSNVKTTVTKAKPKLINK